MPTTTITAHVGKNKDWLEHVISCPTTYYIHKVPCGDRRLFLNFERSWTLRYGMVTQRTLSAMAALMSATTGDSTQAFDLSMDVTKDTFKLVMSYLVSGDDVDANDLAFCNPRVCTGYCGPAKDVCDEGLVVYDADTGVPANVDYTVNGGTTWTLVAGPFGNDEHIISAACFPVSDGTLTRWIVARGVTDGANPPEIGWTDDSGTTWHLVNIGTAALNGIFHLWTGALFALDYRHIWSGLSNGDIYFSDDGGVTWTEQAPGTTTDGINYIHFVDENYGLAVCAANQMVLFTRDGGRHWNALAGPGASSLLCCDILNAHRAWIGDGAGHLWYTNVLHENMVAGDWAERLLDTPTGSVSTDRINDIMFVRESGASTDDHCGFLVTKWEDGDGDYHGAIYRTINGGFDWEIWYTGAMDSTVTYGLDAVWACGQNLAYAVGDLISGAPTIITLNGASP